MLYILNEDRETLTTATSKEMAVEILGHLSAKFGRMFYAVDERRVEVARTILPKL